MIAPELYPPPHQSWKQVVANLPEDKREAVLASLSDTESGVLLDDWFFTARREQLPPLSDWFIWVMMAGRGFGKNYSGSHWLIDQHLTQGKENSAIVAATASDLRRYCLEGPSGIMSLAPRHFYPEYKKSQTKLVWPNGTETHLFTSEKPNRLRGANHDAAWCDELSYWTYAEEAWDMLMLTLRHGTDVKCMVTMTPRPVPAVRSLLLREGKDVAVTRGATMDNFDNLSETFQTQIITQYAGTRLERQEIYGELLLDVEGALWEHEQLEELRIMDEPELRRIIIGVDPSTTSGENADEVGIIVVGQDKNNKGYVLGDYSGVMSPKKWASKVVSLYHAYGANKVVAEKNQGGEMISTIIHNEDEFVPIDLVHASKGKVARAEPVALLYEQHRIHHVGIHAKLEDEMCMFVPGDIHDSPNRVDAMVWAFTGLLLTTRQRAGVWGRRRKAA